MSLHQRRAFSSWAEGLGECAEHAGPRKATMRRAAHGPAFLHAGTALAAVGAALLVLVGAACVYLGDWSGLRWYVTPHNSGAGAGDVGTRGAGETLSVNSYFDRVFFINDEGNVVGRDRMRALFAQHGVVAERFSVNTSNGAFDAEHRQYMARSPSTYESRLGGKQLKTPRDLAALKTWESLIRTARERGYRRILVFGDDVRFHSNFAAEFDRKVRILPRDWKLLYLGARQHSWKERSLTWIPALSNEFYHPLATDGSFAIGIDSTVFHILLFEIGKALNTVASGALRAVLVPFHRQSFVFSPNLVVDGVDRASSADALAKAEALRWDASLYEPLPPPLPLPKVCVVMTVRNASRTIEYAVGSLLQQTYRNIEVVVVDDKSEDDTPALLKELAARDSRIVVVTNEVNKGTYPSRNVGLRHCTGEVYANHDGDDVAMPDRIAAQLEPIVDNRADITFSLFVRSHISLEDFRRPTNEVYELSQLARIHRYPSGWYMYCCREKLGLMTTMVRMSVFKEVGVFDEARFSGDLELIERYLAKRLHMFVSDGLFNAHALFDTMTWAVPPFIERLNRTLVIAYDSDTSLSHLVPIKGNERRAYEADYRRRHVNETNPLVGDDSPF